MCLGVPGKILEIYEQDSARMGKVDFGGIVKDICLDFVPDVQIGDYTIVHVGFAITQLDEESAKETLALFEDLGILEEELNVEEAEADDEYAAPPVGD